MYGQPLGIIWHERFREISFSHPMIRDISKKRISEFRERVSSLTNVMFITPRPAPIDALYEVHDKGLIERIMEASKLPYIGFLDSGDTVHYPGMFEDVLLVAGSALTAIEMSNYLKTIYVPLGGFHHATKYNSMGFCPINDVNLTINRLMNLKQKVAVLDVDAHHPNGVEEMFYEKPVLKISIFAYDGSFFPGTGDPRRRGDKEGKGLNYNVALPLGAADDSFEEALRMLRLLEEYDPSYLVVIAGVDGHKDDGLKSLNLTSNSYNLLGYKISKLFGRRETRIISFGGGGYGQGSALSMYSFVLGLQGFLKKEEVPTQDFEKRHEVKKLVDSFLEGFSSSL
ncbi:histone deacetylase family protein [Metallosphaera tengchongensis]|uniref:Histone deacetylase family protein n=1 Tax=Metallosphaera tengchongensis TaxID=1532350 RepID=A0A6N0NR60_9CREN|nr:histone deacetylase family protein [Metallosphaera tengchongensis]QKQ99225.1 histone deacetylase family protein [Metallosphaera tengchongensis]